MTFKLERCMKRDWVVFTLSGRIKAEEVEELQKLFELEVENRCVRLDLQEVKLVDQDAVRFLAGCVMRGVQLENCPAYIREWIEKETPK